MEYWEERLKQKWEHFKQYIMIGAVMALGLKLNQDAVKRESINREKIFAAKEAAYQKRIHELELQTNKFRFSDYLSNGVKTSDWKAVDNQKFVNNRISDFEAFQVPELTAEAIKAADSLKDETSGKRFKQISFEELLAAKKSLRKEVVVAYQNGQDTIFLAKSRQLFDYTLAQMHQNSNGQEAMVRQYLGTPTPDLERRAKIVGHMIELKAKNRIYTSKKAFMKDFGELALMENIVDYRSLAAGVDAKLNDIAQKHQNLVTKDSLAFEAIKIAQKDSLIKDARKIKLPTLNWQQYQSATAKHSGRGG